MPLYPVAGANIYIGQQMNDSDTDLVQADFSAMSWVVIDGWSQMGTLGDTAALISTDLINRGRTVKQKGTFNAGSMQNVFAIIPNDSGQDNLIAAAGIRQNYGFRIVFDDTPVGGSTPSERMFIALVMSKEEAGGDANTIMNYNVTLEVNSNIVVIAAT